MGINGKPPLDATLVFRLQFFCSSQYLFTPVKAVWSRYTSKINFFLKPQVVQHPVEAPYLHYEEGCHSVIVPSCGFFGHRVLWGHKWYVTWEATFFSINFGHLSIKAQSQNLVAVWCMSWHIFQMIQIARGRRNALQVLEARFLTSFVMQWTNLRAPYAYRLPL